MNLHQAYAPSNRWPLIAPGLAVSLALAGPWAAQVGHAQPPEIKPCPVSAAVGAPREAQPEPPTEYRALVDQALTEHAARRFMEARALLLRAHDLFPNARTLRGLGNVEYELSQYARAAAYLERALGCPTRALTGELRTATEALLVRTLRYVGTYRISLVPATAELWVDKLLTRLPQGGRLRLNLGAHTVAAHASGYQSQRHALQVTGGETRQLTITLRANVTARDGAPTAPAVVGTGGTDGEADGGVLTSPWLWTGVGAAIITGVIVAVAATSGGGGKSGQPARGGSSGVTLPGP